MCEIVYNILITNFTVHRCIIRSNAPSNLQMQPLGCIFVYALNCIKKGTAIDPACGSGSLLLKAEKVLGRDAVRNGFFGQEINITTYNLCRINMFLHDIEFDKFNIACEDPLTKIHCSSMTHVLHRLVCWHRRARLTWRSSCTA